MGPSWASDAALSQTWDALPLVGSLLSVTLIGVRIVLGVALFAHSLPRRTHFGARCAGLGCCALAAFAAFLAITAYVGSVSVAVGNLLVFLVFSLIMAAAVGGLLALCDASVWTALFCVTAGYTAQNLATGATELVASVARGLGADPALPGFALLNDLVCMGIVYTACYLLLARRIDHEGLMQMENHQMLLMMPVVSLAIIGFDVIVKSLTAEGVALVYVVALRAFHGLACVATLWIEYQMLYRQRIEQERSTAERLLAEHERQYRLSRSSIDAINVKCHDLRHQIRSLAQGGAVVSDAVLNDLARELSIYDSAIKSGNDALDTILTEKSLLCERSNVTLTCIADGSALDFMAAADLYALFGNALDNAIEAAVALEDAARRSVSVQVRRTMGCASIHVENYCAVEPRFAEGLPLTTKADRSAHGFGTRSMRQIAERYGGTFSASASDGIFRLDIMIPLP